MIQLLKVSSRSRSLDFQFILYLAHGTFINIRNQEGRCNSNIGWQGVHWGTINRMSLSSRCHNTDTIEHEFLHALGMNHEQTRPDRDEHINLFLDRVEEYFRYNFDIKQGWMDTNSPYDKRSVMHYGHDAFMTDEAEDAGHSSVMTDKVTGDPVQYPDAIRMSSEDAFQLAGMYESFCPPDFVPASTCDDGQRYLSNFAWYIFPDFISTINLLFKRWY